MAKGLRGLPKQRAGLEASQFNRRDMLSDSAFWLAIIWLVFVPSFTITGLLFHQIYIAELKQIDLMVWVRQLQLLRHCRDYWGYRLWHIG